MLAPAALITASRGTRSIRPSSLQLDERLAEGAAIAQVAAGNHDPVGHLPAQRFQHPIHDRLLPFEAEGVDAVDEIDAELAGDLLHALHGVVEVAGDLHGQGAVVEGLGQLAVGNLAAADEDHGPHQTGRGAEDSERRAGVAGAGAGGAAGADHAGMGERGRHAVVLEAARGVQPFVLQEQLARLQADVRGHGVGALQDGLTLADGHHLSGGANGSSS